MCNDQPVALLSAKALSSSIGKTQSHPFTCTIFCNVSNAPHCELIWIPSHVFAATAHVGLAFTLLGTSREAGGCETTRLGFALSPPWSRFSKNAHHHFRQAKGVMSWLLNLISFLFDGVLSLFVCSSF